MKQSKLRKGESAYTDIAVSQLSRNLVDYENWVQIKNPAHLSFHPEREPFGTESSQDTLNSEAAFARQPTKVEESKATHKSCRAYLSSPAQRLKLQKIDPLKLKTLLGFEEYPQDTDFFSKKSETVCLESPDNDPLKQFSLDLQAELEENARRNDESQELFLNTANQRDPSIVKNQKQKLDGQKNALRQIQAALFKDHEATNAFALKTNKEPPSESDRDE